MNNKRWNKLRIQDAGKINACSHELIATTTITKTTTIRRKKHIYAKRICITLKINDRTRQWQRKNLKIGYGKENCKGESCMDATLK